MLDDITYVYLVDPLNLCGFREERQILHKLCRWVRESKWKQNQVKEIEWQQGSNQKKKVAKPNVEKSETDQNNLKILLSRE